MAANPSRVHIFDERISEADDCMRGLDAVRAAAAARRLTKIAGACTSGARLPIDVTAGREGEIPPGRKAHDATATAQSISIGRDGISVARACG